MGARLSMGVYKFSSCDGCQLALLNLGEGLLALAREVEIVHFAEAGPLDPERPVDIALVEGSLSGPADFDRIRAIRSRSRWLLAVGACATSGGLQALRNLADRREWLQAVYPNAEHLAGLGDANPLSQAVSVDLELWGCPVTGRQVVAAVRDLRVGVLPRRERETLCLECKREQRVCTLVSAGAPCLGPVTRAGCGALCPGFGRACYGCTGPAETLNAGSLGRRIAGLGLLPEDLARRFLLFHSSVPAFREATSDTQGRRR
jgi:coenzyme F420-reducing hydrogenase gamma subunit